MALELRRDALDPADPGRADRDLRAHGRQPPPGLGDLRRDARRCSSPLSSSSTSPSRTARPAMHAAGIDGFNMEGKEQRFGIASTSLWAAVTTAASCGAVNGAMESLTGVRRFDPDGADADRRGDLRRRRLRPVRHAAVRHPRRLHLRPDGRPHARVPRQEDRGARGQAHDRRRDRRADARAARDRARDRPSGARSRSTTPDRRASRRRCTPTRRRATTTARRSPATPATCSRTAPTTAPSASRSPTCSAAWR